MTLNVYYQDKLTGKLKTTSNKGIVFSYEKDATYPISISIPLSDKEYTEKECLPFFSGLLPDGLIREKMARNIHVSSQSIIKLLASYGEDVAGALVIKEENDGPPTNINYSYREISEEEISNRIKKRESETLLLWGTDVRLSLAGTQDKLPLMYDEGKWYLPMGGAPSNVIIKQNANI